MARYFSGGSSLGSVSAMAAKTFAEFCAELAAHPARIALSRDQFHALPKKDKAAGNDQEHAKQVRYFTPCTFATTPAHRNFANAGAAHLIAVDIDPNKTTGSTEEAEQVLADAFVSLEDFGYIAWHTASSTPEAPRLRVVVNAEGIRKDRYGDAVLTIAEMLGVTANTESRVVCQPMYFPTVFVGDTSSPILASNPDGKAFRIGDIVGSSTDEGEPPVDDDALPTDAIDQPVGLEYLKGRVEGVTAEHVAEALGHLDPDCTMQEWIEVGAAIKHQFGENGWPIWLEWSRGGKEKFAGDEATKARWKSLKEQPAGRLPRTIRSVLSKARANGWESRAVAQQTHKDMLAWITDSSRSSEELMDTAPSRLVQINPLIGPLERKNLLNILKKTLHQKGMELSLVELRRAMRSNALEAQKITGWPSWTHDMCYMTASDEFYRQTNARRFAPAALDRAYTVQALGDDEPMRPQEFLLRVVGVPRVETTLYDPRQHTRKFFDYDDKPYVNTYRPTYVKADPDREQEAADVIEAHCANLIKEPQYQRLFLSWLAFHPQNPGIKIHWTPLIQSTKGGGKTFWGDLMRVVLGSGNVACLNPLDIMNGNFNDWACGSQLVVVNEVRIIGQNRHAVMDKIKPCITDAVIPLHQKFERHMTVENVTNYVMFTNWHDALAIQPDERRYFVIESPLQDRSQVAALGGPSYFQRLYDQLTDNPGGVRAFFENYPIDPQFSPKGDAPITPYFMQLAENSNGPLASAILEVIDDQPHPLVRRDIVSAQALRGFVETLPGMPDFTDQTIGNILREAGYKKVGRHLVGEERQQLFVKNFSGDVVRAAKQRWELF